MWFSSLVAGQALGLTGPLGINRVWLYPGRSQGLPLAHSSVARLWVHPQPCPRQVASLAPGSRCTCRACVPVQAQSPKLEQDCSHAPEPGSLFSFCGFSLLAVSDLFTLLKTFTEEPHDTERYGL